MSFQTVNEESLINGVLVLKWFYTKCLFTADGSIRVWDSSQHGGANAVCVFGGGGGGGEGGRGEVLACDWSKYDHHTIVTAGVDTVLRYT